MTKSRAQSERSVVVVDVVVFVVVAVAECDHSGHDHRHDSLRLSRDCRALQSGGFP